MEVCKKSQREAAAGVVDFVRITSGFCLKHCLNAATLSAVNGNNGPRLRLQEDVEE